MKRNKIIFIRNEEREKDRPPSMAGASYQFLHRITDLYAMPRIASLAPLRRQ
ncbi:MAG: hypothetical protein LBC53_05095 [Spirochaetaceae bacterium]|jgi:hypothetical protein|nr:hypothetical protein [Spirochaetaceae bacterium]